MTTENKLREIKGSVELWLKYTDLNRKNDVILNRLRIGHTKLTHGHLMTKEEIHPYIQHAIQTSQSNTSSSTAQTSTKLGKTSTSPTTYTKQLVHFQIFIILSYTLKKLICTIVYNLKCKM
jgi:hypothetical protein